MRKTLEIIRNAKENSEFLELSKKHIMGIRIPGVFTDRLNDGMFAMLYVGYLLGKHQDDPDKYLEEVKP